jgi:hypothetical protein
MVENHPDFEHQAIHHVYSFFICILAHENFSPRKIWIQWFLLSCYFYIAYVKWINIFRSPLLPQMEESGEVLETACDLILLDSMLGRKMHFQEHRGPMLDQQPIHQSLENCLDSHDLLPHHCSLKVKLPDTNSLCPLTHEPPRLSFPIFLLW